MIWAVVVCFGIFAGLFFYWMRSVRVKIFNRLDTIEAIQIRILADGDGYKTQKNRLEGLIDDQPGKRGKNG